MEKLDARIRNHDREIEKMCNFHHQGFVDAIKELLKVRADAEKLMVTWLLERGLLTIERGLLTKPKFAANTDILGKLFVEQSIYSLYKTYMFKQIIFLFFTYSCQCNLFHCAVSDVAPENYVINTILLEVLFPIL